MTLGCRGENENYPESKYRPLPVNKGVELNFDDFIQMDEKSLMTLDADDFDDSPRVGVFSVNNKPHLFTTSEIENYTFNLIDGTLKAGNHGEWGGEIIFVPNDKSKPQDTIVKNNVSFIFSYHDKLYYTTGLFSRGGIWELKRDGNKFTSSLEMELVSPPRAMLIRNDKIYFACYDGFIVLEDFQLVYANHRIDWMMPPNSIVIDTNEDIYVGMYAGYAILSMDVNIFRQFKYDNRKGV